MYSDSKDEYIVKSPFPDIQIPKKTFTQLIWERHENWKHLRALECGVTGEKYSYAELLEKSENIGKGLLNEGLRSGDVLAILLPNMPDYVATILGAANVGLTICSINPQYTPDEISYHLQPSGARGVLTFPEKLPDILKVVDKLYNTGVILKNFIIVSVKSFNGQEISLPTGVISLDDIIKKGKRSRDDIIRNSSDHFNNLALIANSSGTTGLPKGVSLTHRNVTASMLQMAHQPMSVFQETTSSHQDVIPVVLPLFHNLALEIILDALYHGSKVITFPKFEEKKFLPALKTQKATLLFVVPPMILFLGSKDEITKDHLKHLRCIVTAAAPIGDEDILRCLRKAPRDTKFVQGYGLTEAMCLLTQVPYGKRNFKSVGVPLPNTEIKICDLDDGSSKQPFQHGEICFRGPQMSLGYLNNPKATQETIDDEGWFHSGDIGYYDEEGYLYVVDRIKELIKVKGFQVAPAELEAVLRSHPAVEDAAVTGMPDEWKGEVPVAFIKPKTNTTILEEDLKKFLSEKVAPFKMVEKFIFIDSIPKSPSGKILRRSLKILCKS